MCQSKAKKQEESQNKVLLLKGRRQKIIQRQLPRIARLRQHPVISNRSVGRRSRSDEAIELFTDLVSIVRSALTAVLLCGTK